MPDTKRCPSCKHFLPLDRFENNRATCEKCLQSVRDWRAKNKDKVAANNKAWREANPEKRRADLREWKRNNRERCRAKYKEYYESNRERILAGFRERDRKRLHDPKYRSLKRLKDQRRRATKWGVDSERFTREDLREYWSDLGIDPDVCFYCGDDDHEHDDHVVPLSRGGTHTMRNMLPSCAECNMSKCAKLLSEWRDGVHEETWQLVRVRQEIAVAEPDSAYPKGPLETEGTQFPMKVS